MITKRFYGTFGQLSQIALRETKKGNIARCGVEQDEVGLFYCDVTYKNQKRVANQNTKL